MDYPTVTIVIPVRNEEHYIGTVLQNCLNQDYPHDRIEIIVAEGRSNDGTLDAINRFLSVHHEHDLRISIVDNPYQDLPHGFNRAIRESRSDIILLIGAHAIYAKNYVSECISVLMHSGADNVGGPTKAIASTYIGKCIAFAYNSAFAVGGAKCHSLEYTGEADTVTFGCWWRKYLLAFGGYDEELIRNHDDELNFRIILSGGKVYQSASIRSWYFSRDSIPRLLKQQIQYGYEKMRVMQKHRRPASIRHIVPLLFVAGLIFGTILSAVSTVVLQAFVSVLLLYAVLSLVCSAKVAACYGWEYFLTLPIVYLTYHIGYGFGSLIGVLDFYLFHAWFKKHTRFVTSLSR